MTSSTPSSVSELMSEVRKRLDASTPDLKNILEVLKEQWPIAEIKVRCTFIDLKSDLARLLEICEVYEAALRFIGQNAPLEAMKIWQAGSLLNIIEIDAAAANDALQAADAIAAGEGATE